MAGPLFPFTVNSDFESHKFQPFNNGFIFPLVSIKKGTTVTYRQFLDGMAVGSIMYSEEEPIAYFFTTVFKYMVTDEFLLVYMNNKIGKAKEGNRIHASNDVVIVDFPNCGMLIANSNCDSFMSSLLDK
jgi:hypothetical protein